MNPGLAVKLRPTGPWRVGSDSGARNRVDFIYHSDSLYSAVTQAMSRLGSLEDWLNATARAATPAVRFSSCFPMLEGLQYVIPPRTVWPPSSPALLSARVRWKSARFVPIEVVQAVLSGRPLDGNRWAIDGPSECLVPSGKAGPFRTAVRWSAAVDRLTGAAERHSMACIEFRPGAGLWTIVAFEDEAARDRWQNPVKAAFRWLADAGFGGERSRGWGRSETPEFVEGTLPEMLLASASVAIGPDVLPGPIPDPTPETPPAPPIEEPGELPGPEPPVEPPPPDPDPNPFPPAPEPLPARPATGSAHWLLSLFTPAEADTIDWSRGSYTLLARGGRVESPAGSGELKKQLPMVAEGSVVYSESAPCGAAPDVAPDGFAHPVFRAGFAVSIPLPEGA
jgi:CRISPR type III-A-associated RAMP protein Csm4